MDDGNVESDRRDLFLSDGRKNLAILGGTKQFICLVIKVNETSVSPGRLTCTAFERTGVIDRIKGTKTHRSAEVLQLRNTSSSILAPFIGVRGVDGRRSGLVIRFQFVAKRIQKRIGLTKVVGYQLCAKLIATMVKIESS
jgi:hypothetical protein